MTIPSGRILSHPTGRAVRDGAGRLARRTRLALERARERARRELRRLIAANTAGALHRALGDRADDDRHPRPPLGRALAGTAHPAVDSPGRREAGALPVAALPAPALPGADPLAA